VAPAPATKRDAASMGGALRAAGFEMVQWEPSRGDAGGPAVAVARPLLG
jgi:hypothetical protein